MKYYIRVTTQLITDNGAARRTKEGSDFQTIECDAEHCIFNPNGICLAPLINQHPPNWDTDDGCADCIPPENID